MVLSQRLSIYRYSPWVSPHGFVSAHVLEFKRINRFTRLNLVRERSQIRKRLPKVNIYILIIAGMHAWQHLTILYVQEVVTHFI